MIESKESFEQRIDTQLREWRLRIDELETEIVSKQADPETAERLREQVATLRQRHEDAMALLEELKDSDRDAWKAHKRRVERAAVDLGRAVESAPRS
jgi:hypothetical protein